MVKQMGRAPRYAPSRVIGGLGIVQILAWGSSYYLLTVLAPPISSEMGWPISLVVAGFSLGMFVSGIAAPRVGRFIGERGGRRVLLCGCLLLAAGQLLLGLSSHVTTFFVAWLIIGLGMSASLYDAAFSTLGQLYGLEGRRHITALTLFGGFASTICWPLSAFFVEALGWRGACFAYAAIQIAVSWPLIWGCIPRHATQKPPGAAPDRVDAVSSANERLTFWIMAAMLMGGGIIASLISLHLLTLHQEKGIALSVAVALGVLVGPSQVGARVIEMAFGKHYHPLWTLAAASALLAIGVALLLCDLPVLLVALCCYGAGNGIWSIARGTVPLVLFGAGRYPVIMGKLAMPGLIAQSAAPFVGAVILEHGGATWTIAFLILLAVINLGLMAVLSHVYWRRRAP